MKEIPIIFACDDKFAIGLSLTLHSLLSSMDKNTFYNIYVLDGGISDKNKKKINRLKQFGNNRYSLSYIDMVNYSNEFKKIKLNNKRFSQSVFYRLLIPRLFKNKYDKVIFLDCDLIIDTDLSKLLEIDLGEMVFAGVPDIGIRYFYNTSKEKIRYYQAIGFNNKSILKYVNAGMMVWNLKEFSKHPEYLKELRAFFFKHEICYLNDQDAINSIFYKRIKLLEPRWNLQILWDNKESYKNDLVYIYHFAGNKPWIQEVIPHLPFFPYYRMASKYFPFSPWKFTIMFNTKIKFPIKLVYIKITNKILKIISILIPVKKTKSYIEKLIWRRICPE
mgnify:CR=1 FL=1